MNLIERAEFKVYLRVVLLSVLSVLLVDAVIGEKLLLISKRESVRVRHEIYHHALAPNYDGFDLWGKSRYRICTDGNGFRSECGSKTEKHFDVAIIGDSFVEGIGLPYDQTFVGNVAASNPKIKVANLGVASYSPSIYLARVQYLINQGITFDRLYVFVDISDIQDEAISYKFEEGKIVENPSSPVLIPTLTMQIKVRLLKSFPMTYTGLSSLYKRIFPEPPDYRYLTKDFARGAWTYDKFVDGYGAMGVDNAVVKSVAVMEALFTLTRANNIRMSVGVYPWPSQLLFDNPESRQVKVWRDFCAGKCEFFFNAFDSFFSLTERSGVKAIIQSYYLEGDVHLNEKGHKVLADTILNATSK